MKLYSVSGFRVYSSLFLAMELSYSQLKSASEARESEEQRIETRKRSLLLLIHNYLSDQGYLNTGKVTEKIFEKPNYCSHFTVRWDSIYSILVSASTLIEESNISLRKFALCDNIDLETVLQVRGVFLDSWPEWLKNWMCLDHWAYFLPSYSYLLLQEFNSYYNIKFGRNPKIVKRLEQNGKTSNGHHPPSGPGRKQSGNLPRYVFSLHQLCVL